jgi:glycosyltransferase involved in cell wall biosynthesis
MGKAMSSDRDDVIRILALVPSELGHSPGQRSTIELWERTLRNGGVTLEYAAFENARLRSVLGVSGHGLTKAVQMLAAYSRRVRLMRRVAEFDAVYVYREAALIGPALLEREIARQGKPIIYSLDDPLYVPYISPANGWLSYLKFFGKVATICRLSALVIANSRFHRDFAERHARRVIEIPSLVDEKVFRFRPERPLPPPVCIGWTGSASTAANLGLIADALREAASGVDFRLLLVGATEYPLPNVVYHTAPWHLETEISDLQKMEIGLLPLADTPWNRRKFNLKLAQYMALGIVPVATPLGENPNVIEHGVDGFLASSHADWVHFLERLASDATLRRALGQGAALKARSRFTMASQASAVVSAFRSVVAG